MQGFKEYCYKCDKEMGLHNYHDSIKKTKMSYLIFKTTHIPEKRYNKITLISRENFAIKVEGQEIMFGADSEEIIIKYMENGK